MTIKAALVAALLLAAAGVARSDDRNFEQKVVAQPNGSVEISNVAGSLDIVGWDRSEVEVKGTIGEGVERVDVSGSGGRSYVKVIVRKHSDDGEAELTVNVPKGSEVDATTVSADLTTKGLQGRQRLSTVSGEVAAEIVGADSQVKSVSGDIVLRGTQQPADLRMSTVSGNLRLERGAGEVEATSISGDVFLEVSPARNVRLHSTSGSLDFRGELSSGATVEAETVSGAVNLNARAKAGYEYELKSFAGEISRCFAKEPEQTEPHVPGSRLDGTLGQGDGHVTAKSMSGEIIICNK
jgi:DUF4097 and DUF4098 domain-containing protein YvlB